MAGGPLTENETPELYTFIDKMDSELGDVWTSDRDCLANVLDTYASLQCAEMKEERDFAVARLRESEQRYNASIERNIDKQEEIKQLQEEVERLKKENTKTSALLDLASADARLSREEVERLRSENETLRAYRNTL